MRSTEISTIFSRPQEDSKQPKEHLRADRLGLQAFGHVWKLCRCMAPLPIHTLSPGRLVISVPGIEPRRLAGV